MRRIYAAVAILILLSVITIISGYLVYDTSQTLLQGLNQIEQHCAKSDFANALQCINRINRYYQEREHLLALFIRRDLLGDIAVRLNGLSAYASKENFSDLKSEISQVKMQIQIIHHLFFDFL